MVRIAINGFGRIGRQVLQAGLNEKKIQWVAVNDLTDTKTLAYLFKYDSVFGRFPGTVQSTDDTLIINGKRIKVLSEKDPKKLPWKQLGVDVVIESTGFFTQREDLEKHISAGAKKVLITAPTKGPDITVVKGVNLDRYNSKQHNIVSNASCTTNALAPMVHVLNKNLGVINGFMITTHAYTATQRVVDGPSEDLRRGRAAAVNIIPSTTGAAKTVAEVIPELKGKLDGFALRVPVVNGSYVSFVATVKKSTSSEEVNKLFKIAAMKELKEVLQYCDEPLVSTDIIKNSNSCVFDSLSTNVLEGNLVCVSGWYDNEWGYSCRVVDVAKELMR
ncbi:type I glyceraldehyde-3-phosphate dehydrogenase [Candidatus Woesearchaeota archaeon]|nr:type I glyceraldehyde-3-phosphate dehydrogenase [Candidatus Woesearchaeota archaeon]